jgi:hypothetical protein
MTIRASRNPCRDLVRWWIICNVVNKGVAASRRLWVAFVGCLVWHPLRPGVARPHDPMSFGASLGSHTTTRLNQSLSADSDLRIVAMVRNDLRRGDQVASSMPSLGSGTDTTALSWACRSLAMHSSRHLACPKLLVLQRDPRRSASAAGATRSFDGRTSERSVAGL